MYKTVDEIEKKIEKYFLKQTKKGSTRKKILGRHIPPTGKASIRRQNSRKVMRQPHIPIKGVLIK